MYHDVTEIITGDMPTPIKYYNPEIRHTYKEIEDRRRDRLCFPCFRKKCAYPMKEYLRIRMEDAYLWKLVKAADKLSAYIKCIEEEGCRQPGICPCQRDHVLKQLHGLRCGRGRTVFDLFY